MKSMKIFSGSSNQPLAQKIAKLLKSKVSQAELSKFPNGECRVRLLKKTEGETCVVVQSFSRPVNDHLVEFLLMVDALYRMGAQKILAVIPWMGYSPQDKVFRPGEPLSAKVIGSIISGSLVDRIFTFDIHNDSIAGFFSKPLENLSADDLFIKTIKKTVKNSQTVVVSPDFGAIKRSHLFAQKLDIDEVIVDKYRDRISGLIKIRGISGSVKGKICLLFDDFISTGQTAVQTADYLKSLGAKKVYFMATHHFDIDGVSEKLQNSQIDRIFISDTIKITNPHLFPKIKVLTVSKIISDSLKYWL